MVGQSIWREVGFRKVGGDGGVFRFLGSGEVFCRVYFGFKGMGRENILLRKIYDRF